jgi:hypothetical protein
MLHRLVFIALWAIAIALTTGVIIVVRAYHKQFKH